MFAALLAISLAAAPIPKSQYEGRIAVLIRDPKPELIVFNPNGNIENRIPLHDLGVDVYGVNLGRDGKTALLTTQSHVAARLANQDFASNNGYLIDLTGIEKPKKLITGKADLHWILNRDCTKAYGAYLDEVKSAKADPSDIFPYESWCLDLKTGVTKPIDLPDTHRIVEMTADDRTVLTMEIAKSRYYTATAVVGKWKPMRVSDLPLIPCSIAPDGKKCIVVENAFQIGQPDTGLKICDFELKSRRPINRPADCQQVTHSKYAPDGKRICLTGRSRDPMNPQGFLYKLYVCGINGTNPKLIFDGKEGELLSDFDWR